MKYIHITFLLFMSVVVSTLFSSCENVLVPTDENLNTEDRLSKDPSFSEGLLMTAYLRVPSRSIAFDEVATDDAVSNNKTNDHLRMATGQWSASFNPKSMWDNSISSILYLNKFLSYNDQVEWKWSDSELNTLYKKRFYGEAYALRGLFELLLLESCAGIGENGELLGIPIIRDFIEVEENFNIPRLGFFESVDSIYADFDHALEFLTMDDYVDIQTPDQLPEGYGEFSVQGYNEIFGKRVNQRISGRVVKALKARLALLAASPAFNLQNERSLWENAAMNAAEVININGGINGLDPNGHTYYLPAQINRINLDNNLDQKEIIWRTAMGVTNSLERQCFPPSLFGNGDINPTQNLVDAFPTLDGYPIDNATSGYDENNPYENRDPRLSQYIIYNNSVFKGARINTSLGDNINAKDATDNSTRTGYYLKKLLRDDINLDPVATTSLNHYNVHIRYTEMFLIYAEAANESWGPDGKAPNASYSAKEAIAALRKRAGIRQPDQYVASISSKEEMRDLIRNERRLELCFEGYRFWDMRRWLMDLTEPAMGVNITDVLYSYVQVESRAYNNAYMHYGPIPQREVLKYDALIQNKGWK